MFFKYQREYDERIAEAPTPEQAYFAIWQSWPSEEFLGYISEMPEDQIMMGQGALMFPGFELVDAYRFREFLEDWHDRDIYREMAIIWGDSSLDIDDWNRRVMA